MDYSYCLPVLVLLSLIWLLTAALNARQPRKGTLEWIHRAVSPPALSPDSLLYLILFDRERALAVGLAAFFLTLGYNYPVMGAAAYSAAPVPTVLITEISVGISAACSFLFFRRMGGGVGSSLFAAGLTALVTPLLLPGEVSGAVSLALLYLLFSARRPSNLVLFGALCGAAAYLAPEAILFLLFGLIVSVVFSVLEHSWRRIAFFLLAVFIAAFVYFSLSYYLGGSFALPAFSLSITYVRSAAVVYLIPLAVYSLVRLIREKSFAAVTLFCFLILGILFEFTGITVVWVYAAAAAADAFSAVMTRGNTRQKLAGWLFFALCAATAVLFALDRFGLFPAGSSLISLFSAAIITI